MTHNAQFIFSIFLSYYVFFSFIWEGGSQLVERSDLQGASNLLWVWGRPKAGDGKAKMKEENKQIKTWIKERENKLEVDRKPCPDLSRCPLGDELT